MQDLEIIKVDSVDDLNITLKIRDEVFTKEQGVDKAIEVDEYDSLNDKCLHFIIRYKGIPVGTIRCLFKEDKTIKLQRFCFLKEYRNLGIGKITLEYIENYLKKMGYKTFKLDAQFQVYKFYERCGYHVISDVFYEANIKHVEMIKEI